MLLQAEEKAASIDIAVSGTFVGQQLTAAAVHLKGFFPWKLYPMSNLHMQITWMGSAIRSPENVEPCMAMCIT